MLSRKRAIVFATLLPLLLGVLYTPHVSAQPAAPGSATNVLLNTALGTTTGPTTYTVASLGGESFTASILLANIKSMIGFDYFFTWNPAAVSLTGVLQGDWAGPNAYSASTNATFTFINSTTAGTGTLHFDQQEISGNSMTIGAVPVTLFIVQLKFHAAGSSPLIIPSMVSGTENPLFTFCTASPCSSGVAGVETVASIAGASASSPEVLFAFSPSSLTLAQGTVDSSVTATFTALYGLTGTLDLSTSGAGVANFGLNATFRKPTVSITTKSASASQGLSISVQACLATGTHIDTITATLGSLVSSAPLTVNVTPATPATACITASPHTNVGPVTTTATVTIEVCGTSSLPSGTTVGLSVTVPRGAPGAKLAAKSVTLDSTTACGVGFATVSLTLTVGSKTAVGPFAIQVTASIARVPVAFIVVTGTV